MSDRHGGNIYGREIRLDFSVSTNPFGMPEAVREALQTCTEAAEKYPELGSGELRDAIAQKLIVGLRRDGETNLAPETIRTISREQILVGNGASELIMALAHAFAGEKVLLQQPVFSGYERAFSACRCELLRTEVGKDYELTEKVCEQIHAESPKLAVFCNPGNPTGALVPPDLMKRIADTCKKVGTLLLVDECFLGFVETPSDHSAVRFFAGSTEQSIVGNIVVLSAFTKIYAIPGVRLGYLICSGKDIAARIGAHLPEWNISAAAEAAGLAALAQDDYVKRTTKEIRGERDYLCRELAGLGMGVVPGDANFILFRSPAKLWEPLMKQGILIRKCDNFPGIERDGYYRIAVKKHSENEELIRTIRAISR